MKHVKLLGLALLAIFALSAVASSVASAEDPTILPLPTEVKPLKFTSEAVGNPLLSTSSLKSKIECKKATNKGQFTTQDHGEVTIEFSECKETVGNVNCNNFTVEARIEFVDLLAAPLTLGLWLEPFLAGKKEDVKIKCSLITAVILGGLLAKVDNAKGEPLKSLEKAKEILVLWLQEKDVQEHKTCILLEKLCKGATFELSAKFTAEGGEELAFELAKAKIVFAEEAEVHF